MNMTLLRQCLLYGVHIWTNVRFESQLLPWTEVYLWGTTEDGHGAGTQHFQRKLKFSKTDSMSELFPCYVKRVQGSFLPLGIRTIFYFLISHTENLSIQSDPWPHWFCSVYNVYFFQSNLICISQKNIPIFQRIKTNVEYTCKQQFSRFKHFKTFMQSMLLV